VNTEPRLLPRAGTDNTDIATTTTKNDVRRNKKKRESGGRRTME
jgi:hypothetical protein